MTPHQHGILVINKERGLTSHQVVANLRRILKQTEIGHTGTLDPEATGVLVVGLGQATRSFSFLNEQTKVYQAEIIIGQATDTQDATGQVKWEKPDCLVSWIALNQVIQQLTGEQEQIPPMFSAVKVAGRKLYDLARQGLEIERLPRPITVFSWDIINPQDQYGFKDIVNVEIKCSKGTYIRTLINDLGEKLGTGAHMGKLVRTRSGDFRIEDAIMVAQVEEHLADGTLEQILVNLNTALKDLDSLLLQEDDLKKVKSGGKLSFAKYNLVASPGTVVKIVAQNNQVIAVAKLEENSSHMYWQPVKVFQI